MAKCSSGKMGKFWSDFLTTMGHFVWHRPGRLICSIYPGKYFTSSCSNGGQFRLTPKQKPVCPASVWWESKGISVSCSYLKNIGMRNTPALKSGLTSWATYNTYDILCITYDPKHKTHQPKCGMYDSIPIEWYKITHDIKLSLGD